MKTLYNGITIVPLQKGMKQYLNRWIIAYGLATRYYDRSENGYGCAECCTGDRCDEDCDARYRGRRKECPHCKGKGRIPIADAVEWELVGLVTNGEKVVMDFDPGPYVGDISRAAFCELKQCPEYIKWNFEGHQLESCKIIGQSYDILEHPADCLHLSEMTAHVKQKSETAFLSLLESEGFPHKNRLGERPQPPRPSKIMEKHISHEDHIRVSNEWWKKDTDWQSEEQKVFHVIAVLKKK